MVNSVHLENIRNFPEGRVRIMCLTYIQNLMLKLGWFFDIDILSFYEIDERHRDLFKEDSIVTLTLLATPKEDSIVLLNNIDINLTGGDLTGKRVLRLNKPIDNILSPDDYITEFLNDTIASLEESSYLDGSYIDCTCVLNKIVIRDKILY